MREDAAVQLVEVTRENVAAVVALSVAEDQQPFVANNACSLAEAYVSPERAWPRAIYSDEQPVGFLMLDLVPPDEAFIEKGKREYWLWRLMIDQKHQRKGYGRAAIRAVAAHVRTLPEATHLLTSYKPGDGCAEPFYRGLGFEPFHDPTAGDEVPLRLDLSLFA